MVNAGKRGGTALKRKVFGWGTLLLLSLAYALDTEGLFPYFLTAAVLHELGHAIAIRLCGGRMLGMVPGSFGLTLRYDGLLSYGRDACIALGGPAANLLAAVLGMGLTACVPALSGKTLFSGVNLLLGAFNFLPARPLDGGNALCALLCRRMDALRAENVTRLVSRITGGILTGLGVYILVKTRYNISILAVGSLILGGTYAAGTGTNFVSRAQARPLFRRGVCAGDER